MLLIILFHRVNFKLQTWNLYYKSFTNTNHFAFHLVRPFVSYQSELDYVQSSA